MIKAILDNELMNRIIDIERINTNFNYVKIPRKIANTLRKNSKKKSSYASNKIEGNPLTEEQAYEVIENKSRHLLSPEQEIKNYYLALEYLEEEIIKNTKFNLKLILNTQELVVKGMGKEKKGLRKAMPPGFIFGVYDSKTGNMEYIPPSYDEVEGLLNELIEYVNTSDDHPLIKSAVIHYQLVTIHPFEDGNGRTARLLSEYYLDISGYGFGRLGSLEEYLMYNVQEYYSSLQMNLPVLYYEGRNNPPQPNIWFNYYLRMISLFANKIIENVEDDVNKSLENSLDHLNKKEKIFYDYLSKNKIKTFTPKEISLELNVSNKTIINWCTGLCKYGLLQANLVNKRIRTYTLND